MVVGENDPRSSFEKATDAVNVAAEAVQTTTETIATSIQESRRPGGMLDQLSRFAREAPLRSLVIAFVAGLLIGRRP